MTPNIQKKLLKSAIFFLTALSAVLLLYLLFMPFYPAWKYRASGLAQPVFIEQAREIAFVQEEARQIINNLPQAQYDVSPHRLIIPKIGVNAPIVESANADYGLSRGAWRLPDTSTPDRGGNTVITGHRFKYLPPSNLTFYLFHKLADGDIVSLLWAEEEYYYRIREVKIVADTDLSILAPSSDAIITLFTCHPIYSTAQRLVVIAEKVDNKQLD